MFRIFRNQFTQSEMWDIENSFYNNTERFCQLKNANEFEWLKLVDFIIYPNITSSICIINPMNKRKAILDNQELGIFISLMTLNKFCWDYEYNADKCEFMCDLYYTSHNYVLGHYQNSIILDLLS